MNSASPSDSPRARWRRRLWRLTPWRQADTRFQRIEMELLRGLRRRLDELEPGVESEPGGPAATAAGEGALQRLALSLEQTPEAIENDIVDTLMRPWCSDEARLMGALSEGGSFAMLTLCGPGGLFAAGAPLLRYSVLGRGAGVQCLDLLPLYLARLIAAGLVLALPADETLRTDYQLCEGDAVFRRARDELAVAVPRLKARRETLAISPTGQALWQRVFGPEAG